MDRFVKELEHARGVIGERAEAVRRVFAARGLPAASLSPIGEVERWIDERLPDRRRRHRMAVGLSHAPSWSPGSLVPYDEKNLLGAAEARRLGGALAAAYKDVDPDAPFDFHLVDKYRKLVGIWPPTPTTPSSPRPSSPASAHAGPSNCPGGCARCCRKTWTRPCGP
ncbi:hypothetical protein [Microbispora bryophytorum]|uniref:hypothetical protein n=1 Tax=Microbispora bryophytorum TaxID=1460882 RepID=UPI0033DB7AAA